MVAELLVFLGILRLNEMFLFQKINERLPILIEMTKIQVTPCNVSIFKNTNSGETRYWFSMIMY